MIVNRPMPVEGSARVDSIREGQGTPWGARRAGSLHCADAIGVYPGQHVAGHTLNADSQTDSIYH